MIYSSTNKIKDSTASLFLSENEKPFFLFQIDPELFYSKVNKFYLSDSTFVGYNIESQRELGFSKDYLEKIKYLYDPDYIDEEANFTQPKITFYSQTQINEDTESKALMKITDDGNYGFSSEYIPLVLELKNDNLFSISLLFPRVLMINKYLTNKQVHRVIRNYFGNLIKDNLDDNPPPYIIRIRSI